MKLNFLVRWIMGLGMTLLLSPAWAKHGPTVTEFPTPTPDSLAEGVEVARDGSIWYCETLASRLVLQRPDRSVVEYPVPNNGQPNTLKIGQDGIWFTDQLNNAIDVLHPESGEVEEYRIPSGAMPTWIELGTDGSVWFPEPSGVGRLDANRVFTEWQIVLEKADAHIEIISLDLAGHVWFAEKNFGGPGPDGTNTVRRLDPATNVISEYRVPTLGGTPAGVLANADGTVWVTEFFGNAVALLDPGAAPHTDFTVTPLRGAAAEQSTPGTHLHAGGGPHVAATPVTPRLTAVTPSRTPGWIEYPIPFPDANAGDLRVDASGRLWFEEDAGQIGVLDPVALTITEYPLPTQGNGYYNIEIDPHGRIWITEAGFFAPPSKVAVLEP
ncbi:MAG: antibiotic hydrolase [Acidobacteria bacterium]|nr:MAG: antibiotic hydrolase [Acidobacteriota bacterium]